MSDTIKKVNKSSAPTGDMGQAYLVAGKRQSMRFWSEEPGEAKPQVAREYETLGYVISGKAELHIGEHKVVLEPGDAWLVPEGARHSYTIVEAFEAVESTSPPARVKGRDEEAA